MTKFCVTENTKSQCEKIELKNIIGRVLTVFRDFLVSFIEQSRAQHSILYICTH